MSDLFEYDRDWNCSFPMAILNLKKNSIYTLKSMIFRKSTLFQTNGFLCVLVTEKYQRLIFQKNWFI